jgi:hypothetical protein
MIATTTARPSTPIVQAASPIAQPVPQAERAVAHHHAQILIASDLVAHAMIETDTGKQTEIGETTIETGTETETQGGTETEAENGGVPHQGASSRRAEKRTTTVLADHLPVTLEVLDHHAGSENESAHRSR